VRLLPLSKLRLGRV